MWSTGIIKEPTYRFVLWANQPIPTWILIDWFKGACRASILRVDSTLIITFDKANMIFNFQRCIHMAAIC